jgi:hypothetical protein
MKRLYLALIVRSRNWVVHVVLLSEETSEGRVFVGKIEGKIFEGFEGHERLKFTWIVRK